MFDTILSCFRTNIQLWSAFWDIDADSSGTIRPIEFFTYFNIEIQEFEKHIFRVFDMDKSGVLTFLEFVCCIWNLLTLDEAQLGTLLYLIKDPTGVLKIKASDVKSILEIVSRKRVETSPALRATFDALNRQFTSDVSIDEFCRFCALNLSMVTPVLMLQLQLRKQIIGEKYWTEMTKSRKQHPEQGKYKYVKELQKMVLRKADQFQRMLGEKTSEKKSDKSAASGSDEDGDLRPRKKSFFENAMSSMKRNSNKQGGSSSTNNSSKKSSRKTKHAQGSNKVVVTLTGEEREAAAIEQPFKTAPNPKRKTVPDVGASDKGRGRRSSYFNRPKLIKA